MTPALKELIGEIPNTAAQKNLNDFLENFDLKKVNDLRQLAGGLQALTQMILYIGPHDKGFRDSFELARRCIDSYGKLMQAFMKIEFPEKLQKTFYLLMDMFREYLPDEEYQRMKRIIDDELGIS